MNYFFDRFAELPKMFYLFMLFFKDKLLGARNAKHKKRLANQYLNTLSSLCERFGFFEEKHALDDLCFKIFNPKKYHAIDILLVRYKQQSGKLIDRIVEIFEKTLKEKGYSCVVKGRYKNIYSVSRKMQKRLGSNVLMLNDIFAFRIISKKNSIRLCFEILNLLHDKFSPISGFFKDYITIPKINGYQSIHTGLDGVLPDLDLPIEVQIRTMPMDDFAERGLAAHWIYAEKKQSKLITEKEKKLVKYFSTLSQSHQNTMVYFFSYQGDLFSLEKGSSVLDFAYHIHTEVGHRLKTAIVNSKKQPFSYAIQEGDRIELLLADAPNVDDHWNSFVHTAHAQKKISEFLKKVSYA